MRTSTQIKAATKDNAVITATKDDITLVSRYSVVTAQIEALEAEKKALKEEIISGLEKGQIVDNGVKIASWSLVTSNRFDSTRFKVENENLYKQYLKEESHTTLIVNKNFVGLYH